MFVLIKQKKEQIFYFCKPIALLTLDVSATYVCANPVFHSRMKRIAQNFELAILLPNRQRFTPVERLIHSDRYEGPTPLHCQNPCSIFEAGWPLCFSHGTILFLLSPLSPRSTEKKCRTGVASSSRKKELTEPGSLTNRIVLLTNTNI